MGFEDLITKADLEAAMQKVAAMVRANTKPIEEPYLNLEQAAKYIGVKASTLGEMVRNGEITYIRVGRRIMFRRLDLDAYMMCHRVLSNDEIASAASVK